MSEIYLKATNLEYNVIGVMSGTSLDGVDLIYVNFTKANSWHYKILQTKTVPYTSLWEDCLRVAVQFSSEELSLLNTEYTTYLATIINDFISEFNIKQIDAVCSHGHTILHQPEKGITLQIGNLESLSKLIKQTVICDFRVQDVAYGGQGAPLVPIGDQLLFSEYTHCVNLGGFSNISMQKENRRIAYDICPVNIVLNHYAQQLGLSYDDKGSIAASGKICKPLFEALNSLPFYKKLAPKSLGFEWVNAIVFPLIDSYVLSVKDILCTVVEHVAVQLSVHFSDKNNHVILTGGGVYNNYLLSRIKAHTPAKIVIPSSVLIEFKEALIFAFLGVLKSRAEINVLASVTGAKKNHSSGVVFTYKN